MIPSSRLLGRFQHMPAQPHHAPIESVRPQRLHRHEAHFETDVYRYADAEMGTPLEFVRPQPRYVSPPPTRRPQMPRYGYWDWASLPLTQADTMRSAPSTCPYRYNGRRPCHSGSGDGSFDERWSRLPFYAQRFVWEVSIYGLALHRNFSFHEPIVDLDTALTLCFAVWTGGQVLRVPTHWQRSSWSLTPTEAQTLTQLLGEMTNTEDFRNPWSQGYTLFRIDELLAAMQGSSTLQDTVMNIITQSTTSCADSWALMFNDIELAVRMHVIASTEHSAPRITRQIRELAVGLIKLDVVRRHARAYWLEHSNLDQIEVSLKFEVLLQRRLNLPVASRGWRYAGSYYISERVIEAAEGAARSAILSSDVVDQFLAQWDPWQLHQRRLTANHFTYGSLPERSWQGNRWPAEPLRCVITQEEMHALNEPVFLGTVPHVRVYEHSALMTWWCQDGRDPITRQPIDLTSMFKISGF